MKGEVCIQKTWSKHCSMKAFPATLFLEQTYHTPVLKIKINTEKGWLNPYVHFVFPQLESISHTTIIIFASYRGRVYRILFYPDLKGE